MAVRYDTDEERRLHSNVIHSLADQYHLDEAMIREIYERKLESLMDHARIRIYLSVLAARYVKSFLNHPPELGAGRRQFHLTH